MIISSSYNQTLGKKSLYSNSLFTGARTIKYYSGVDAEIYFDQSIYIDDVVQIAFQVQQNVLPLFGYNSYIYDDAAVGARLIQGQFSINFTQSEYLHEVLQVMNMASDYEKRRSNPLWTKSKNKGFDILINYGQNEDNSLTEGVTQEFITDVRITGCSKQFGPDGEPITETYTFLAKDVAPAQIQSSKNIDSSDTATEATRSQTEQIPLGDTINMLSILYKLDESVGDLVKFELGYEIKDLTCNFAITNIAFDFSDGYWTYDVDNISIDNSKTFINIEKLDAPNLKKKLKVCADKGENVGADIMISITRGESTISVQKQIKKA